MLDAEEVLKKLVKCNTIEDKENKKILDYLEQTLCSIRVWNREKRKVFNNL